MFHERRRDIDTLSAQARILRVDDAAIMAALDGDTEPQRAVAALVRLICGQLSDVPPAKPQQREEREQSVRGLESLLSLARRRAQTHREKAERLGKQFLQADAAYERARGMAEQQRHPVAVLREETQRLQQLGQTLELTHTQRLQELNQSLEWDVDAAKLPLDGSADSVPLSTGTAEHRRKVSSLRKLMGEDRHSEREAQSNLAAAGGDLQVAAQLWLTTTPDVPCSFPERQRSLQKERSSQTDREGQAEAHLDPEPEPELELEQDSEITTRKPMGAEKSYSRVGLLELITLCRARGLYPPHSMDLGFPPAPLKPPGAASSAPSWINGPSAKKEYARNRLWRQTWDKAVGVGEPPPVPRGSSAGLWSKDLPQESRHDLMRNLLMGILQVRYGYDRVKPSVTLGDFLERSLFVTSDSIVRGTTPIAPAATQGQSGAEAAAQIAEAATKQDTEARESFGSKVQSLFAGHEPDVSMKPLSMPLTPNFRPGGVTVYRQLLGLVTFKDTQAKAEALAAAEKAQSEAEQSVPRVSLEARDTTDVTLLTQLCEAELRQSLLQSQEERGAQTEENGAFFAQYKIEAATEQVQRATEALRHRQREHGQAAAELEHAKRRELAYSDDDRETETGSETETDASAAQQWQVFVTDETILRASRDRNRDRDTATDTARESAAQRHVLRQQVLRVLRRADDTPDSDERENSTAAYDEEEIRQMEQVHISSLSLSLSLSVSL